MQYLKTLATFRQRFTSLFRPSGRWVAKFPGDEEMLAAVDFSPEANHASLEAKQAFVRRFEQRPAPRFFIDPRELPRAVSEIGVAHPGWRERVIREAGAWRQRLEAATDWEQFVGYAGPDDIRRDRIHLLHFAPVLAQAALHGRPALKELHKAIEWWMWATEAEASPTAYSSCLLAVYRSMALSWTWAFVAGSNQADVDLKFAILKILLADGRFLASRLGTSYPNNHLLADGFALWYLGTLFPEFREAQAWQCKGEEIWLRELERQIYPDGTSFEHSVHYQEFVCEMAVCYLLLKRRNGVEPAEWVADRTRAMLSFLIDTGGPESSPPPIGDTVEGLFVPLASHDEWGGGAWRELRQALFRQGAPAGGHDYAGRESAFWLLGGALPPQDSPAVPAALAAYPDGGYHVFSDRDASSRMVFRTGPSAGSEVNPGHMHADLLSIYLYLRSKPVIVEAGTYTYRSAPSKEVPGEPDLRAYFLGPWPHNGLCIAGEDPLKRGGGNFPGNPVQSRVINNVVLSSESVSWVEGQNSGTTRYDGHRRGVVHIRDRYWLVYDMLPAESGPVEASFGLQLAADAQVVSCGSAVKLAVSDVGCWVAASHGSPAVLRGQTMPLAGWVSPRYGMLCPAPMLRYAAQMPGWPQALLLAQASESGTPPSVEIQAIAERGYALKAFLGQCVDYVLLSDGREDVGFDGIRFSGRMLWLRTCQGKPVELKWLDGKSIEWKDKGISLCADNTVAELSASASGIAPAGAHAALREAVWQS